MSCVPNVDHAVGDAGLDQVRPAPPPGRIVHDGRVLISRAEFARLVGLSTSSLASLYSRRAESGHPTAVHIDPTRGALYFDEEEALRWTRARRRANHPRPAGQVDFSGDADDLVTMTEAAHILGYAGPATIRSYLSRFPGYFPAPDRTQALPNGRVQKFWRRSRIWEFSERRGSS
ncbi:MAG TPA: hypothetical protein VFE65_36075 [Pseudonocardia sp.]|jgi:hypothetical protein|nr:hypothetical protein [Pseudonocardia sp.]